MLYALRLFSDDSITKVENFDEFPIQPNPEKGFRWEVYVAPEPVPTPPAVVDSISMRQCRLVLLKHNLLDTVNNAISGMAEAAKIEWEYASEVRRDNPLLVGMIAALGLTEAQLDGMFIEASAL